MELLLVIKRHQETEIKRSIGIVGLTSLSGATAGQYTPLGAWGGALIGLIIFLILSSSSQKNKPQPPEIVVGADGFSLSPSNEKPK